MHGLMAPSDAERVTPELRADHVRFIDGLDTDNKVVTGGGLTPATGQFEGAYVVRAHRSTRPARSPDPTRSSALTMDRYGHLFPGSEKEAAASLTAISRAP